MINHRGRCLWNQEKKLLLSVWTWQMSVKLCFRAVQTEVLQKSLCVWTHSTLMQLQQRRVTLPRNFALSTPHFVDKPDQTTSFDFSTATACCIFDLAENVPLCKPVTDWTGIIERFLFLKRLHFALCQKRSRLCLCTQSSGNLWVGVCLWRL